MRRLACCTLILLTTLGACSASGTIPDDPDAPTTTDPAAPTTTVPDPTVPVPAGASVWTTPAAAIATSPRSADWANRLYQYADAYDHDPHIEFGLDAAGNDYSVPIYDAAEATTQARVYQRPVDNWNGRFDVPVGATIPWNPDWLPADGNDGHMAIIDSQTGEEWNFWALSSPSFHPPYLTQVECLTSFANLLAGYDPNSDLCAAAVVRITDPSGQLADVRTYRGNYPPSTEIGIQQSSGLATPAEVASGDIGHALRYAVSPTTSMTGPECPPDVTSPNDPRVGATCGIALAPGGQFNSRGTTSTADQLSKMVPRGTRLVIDASDADIEQWLSSRGYTGVLRSTARTFAVALRDYGLIMAMTTTGPSTIPVSGGRNPATAAGWRSLGIADDGSDLLDGLVTPSRIRVLEPPTNRCNGVSTKRACWSGDTSY